MPIDEHKENKFNLRLFCNLVIVCIIRNWYSSRDQVFSSENVQNRRIQPQGGDSKGMQPDSCRITGNVSSPKGALLQTSHG